MAHCALERVGCFSLHPNAFIYEALETAKTPQRQPHHLNLSRYRDHGLGDGHHPSKLACSREITSGRRNTDSWRLFRPFGTPPSGSLEIRLGSQHPSRSKWLAR